MIKFNSVVIAGILASTITCSAFAYGDRANGEKAVTAYECAQCHPVDGPSQYHGVPTLAGQKYGYLVRTLMHFKFGTVYDRGATTAEDTTFIQRKHPIMNNISDQVTARTIEDISAFYASRAKNGLATDVSEPAQEQLPPPSGVERCETCHGGVRSNPWADTPYLAGQDKTYLRDQLLALWNSRKGYSSDASRHHRLAEIMFLDGQEPTLDAYAEYYSRLRPRQP